MARDLRPLLGDIVTSLKIAAKPQIDARASKRLTRDALSSKSIDLLRGASDLDLRLYDRVAERNCSAATGRDGASALTALAGGTLPHRPRLRA